MNIISSFGKYNSKADSQVALWSQSNCNYIKSPSSNYNTYQQNVCVSVRYMYVSVYTLIYCVYTREYAGKFPQ